MKLRFSNDWLRKRIADNPALDDPQAGPELGSGGLESALGFLRAPVRRDNATDAELQREREIRAEPAEWIGNGDGVRKLPIRYE